MGVIYYIFENPLAVLGSLALLAGLVYGVFFHKTKDGNSNNRSGGNGNPPSQTS